MKHSEDIDDYYNEESPLRGIPNDGIEEIEIEPLNWNDI